MGGTLMMLENENCRIEIRTDETYTADPAEDRGYDRVLNPCGYRERDWSKTFSIHIDLFTRAFTVALIGPLSACDSDCAVLDGETLTVLQDDTITQVSIQDGSIKRHRKLDCFGCNFAIYKVKTGYVIHGEIEITMLDLDLRKKCSFSGRDIFVSLSNRKPFELRGDRICLCDFQDNEYELDLEGNLLG